MSQGYFGSDAPKGKAPQEANERDNSEADDVRFRRAPAYMTIGTGATSQHAARLQAMLDDDSGYGGSTTGLSTTSTFGPNALHSAVQEDRHLGTGQTTDTDRRAQMGAVHQLWYNQHRGTLGRAINSVVEMLRGLQEMNTSWPAHYPSVQRAELDAPARPSSRPGFHHSNTSFGDSNAGQFSTSAPPLRRAVTSLGSGEAESSQTAEKRTTTEPRLVTPQIAQEFSVLKLDLKLGALHQVELVHSLEKGSVASLLDGKISSSIRHLLLLRERIEDTSSKVLVTGDLNAGKSTFCNALLRRKILPEDQQPCTSIFCEVLDARENSGIEEVHAIYKNCLYDRNDESTYEVFSLHEMEKIVTDNETYTQCKVYVKDVRTINESLLNNGVVDIALIDAPGLNMDTTKTTAIFARQEEIDVVVFVVSASNHFTQTSTEFIRAAAAEKAYLFIVVNGYDNIKDKDRCQKLILNQIRALSPATYKEAGELVHFVSSSAIPMAPSPPGGPHGSGGSGTASGGGGGEEPGGNDPNGKGKDKEKIRDFSILEQSLRRFVLEKRARSKLAPAKTYLLNILNDVNVLATVNNDVAQAELDRVVKELEELEPLLESSKRAKAEIGEEIDKTIEATCKDVYCHSRETIRSAILHAGDDHLAVPYPGVFGAFHYAEEVKEAMLSHIGASVADCEDHARKKSVNGVNAIKQLGILHLGHEYGDLNFRPDVMFRRKRDVLARQVEIPTELFDFIDWSTLLQGEEKAGMALTVAGVVGTGVISGYGQFNMALRAAQLLGTNNLRQLIIPGFIVAAATLVFYVLNQIPRSLPHRLRTKISHQLAAIDYVHSNSARISGSVRKVLRFPADSLRVGLERSAEQLGSRRDETLRVRGESEVALKYFRNLVRTSDYQRRMVTAVDLDGHPGVDPQ